MGLTKKPFEERLLRYFNQAAILFGAVTWPNEQDTAPETLLAEMRPLELASPPDGKDGPAST